MLLKEFSLRADFSNQSDKIYIMNKQQEQQDNGNESIFPPLFFIVPLDSNSYCLTKEHNRSRYAYNANHHFSIWLLNNGNELKKNVPGIYKEIIRLLAEKDGTELISSINDLLLRIRSLPNSPIEVPESLFLNKADFY